MPWSSATRRSVVWPANVFSALERSNAGFLKAFAKVRWLFAHRPCGQLPTPPAGRLLDAELVVHLLGPALWHGGAATQPAHFCPEQSGVSFLVGGREERNRHCHHNRGPRASTRWTRRARRRCTAWREWGRVECVRELLERGVAPCIRDNFQMTPLQELRHSGRGKR